VGWLSRFPHLEVETLLCVMKHTMASAVDYKRLEWRGGGELYEDGLARLLLFLSLEAIRLQLLSLIPISHSLSVCLLSRHSLLLRC
jgi:hypothetical protein